MPVKERSEAFKRLPSGFHASGLTVNAAEADVRVDVGLRPGQGHVFFESWIASSISLFDRRTFAAMRRSLCGQDAA